MDPRLLRLYSDELTHLREVGAEFAREFPKIASRLAMDGVEVSDPYVERLLEGFAFLAARVHLKLDAEFPRFTQGLLETVYPDYPEALRKKGVPVAYVAFEGEQHGFRRAENIKRSLDGELYFYSRVFGFELAGRIEPVPIENL